MFFYLNNFLYFILCASCIIVQRYSDSLVTPVTKNLDTRVSWRKVNAFYFFDVYLI
jgi:hypothetical protein